MNPGAHPRFPRRHPRLHRRIAATSTSAASTGRWPPRPGGGGGCRPGGCARERHVDEDEEYAGAATLRDRKRAAKEEKYRRQAGIIAPLEEEIGDFDKRHVGKKIMENRGLTPHRSKDHKNPRKRLRDKFARRRSGARDRCGPCARTAAGTRARRRVSRPPSPSPGGSGSESERAHRYDLHDEVFNAKISSSSQQKGI